MNKFVMSTALFGMLSVSSFAATSTASTLTVSENGSTTKTYQIDSVSVNEIIKVTISGSTINYFTSASSTSPNYSATLSGTKWTFATPTTSIAPTTPLLTWTKTGTQLTVNCNSNAQFSLFNLKGEALASSAANLNQWIINLLPGQVQILKVQTANESRSYIIH